METASLLEIEVAYALPWRQFLRRLQLPLGSTAKEAIRRSGVLSQWPEIDLESAKIGIFSRPATLDTVLQTGDRVEIYRPLTLAPVDARRLRAKQNKRSR
jgi:putative ubiquitin-RnfH superfamily antitoxin RatB of RatAB toxin-antitoxin module